VKLAGVLLAACVVAGCHWDPNGASSANSVPTSTGMATVSWQAPTTNTDGEALTDLAGYRIYYGTNASDLSQSIQLTGVGLQTYVVENLGPGTWYFAVKAVARTGVESALSDIVSKTIG
jgi:hypothetical protein